MIWVVHWEAVPAYLGELQMVLEEAYSVLPFLQKDTIKAPGSMAVIQSHPTLHKTLSKVREKKKENSITMWSVVSRSR